MSTSETFKVEGLLRLREAKFTGLRIDITAGDADARSILSGQTRDPIVAIARQRGSFSDLIGTYWAGVYLISDRARHAMVELRLTGWAAIPIAKWFDGPALPVWLLAITGTCGPMIRPEPGRLDRTKLGTSLDPRTWDGSDIFLPANSQETLLCAPAADRLRSARLTNLVLEPAGLERLHGS